MNWKGWNDVMSKKQALTEFHRGSILAAAERLFAEKGTEKTTMDDIAREAEYSKATLYVYFQSKEEIINAILLSGMVLLKKKIHEAIESHSDWYQAYDAVCRSIVRFYDENPTAYDAATGTMPLVQEADETQKGVADILRVSGEIDEELAGDVIISGEAAQYLDDDDMAGLRERVVEHTPFGTTDFTLRKGMALDHQDIIGAALRFVEPYVRELCDM